MGHDDETMSNMSLRWHNKNNFIHVLDFFKSVMTDRVQAGKQAVKEKVI